MFLNVAFPPPTGGDLLLQLVSSNDNWIKMAALSFCSYIRELFYFSETSQEHEEGAKDVFAAVALLIGAVVVGLAVEV